MIYPSKTISMSEKGFTLVEVIVGAVIFVMLLAAGSSAIVQTQKLAHSNIMHNTARTVLEGYMEQMKGLPFSHYQDVLADPTKVPFETKGIDSLKTAKVIQYDDPLYLKTENKKSILLDIEDEGGVRNTRRLLRFRPALDCTKQGIESTL